MSPPDALSRAAWLNNWKQRYRLACADLLDAEYLLRLRRQIARVPGAAGSPPTVLAGGDALVRARRVVLFAGSYNPLTAAHERVAEAVCDALEVDVFVWALSRVAIDKEAVERATLLDRLAQLDAHVRHAGWRAGQALMLLDTGLYADSAIALRRALHSDAELWVVVGFDKVVQIFDARYYQDRDAALRRLFGAARLLVAPRAGHSADDLRALLAESSNREFAGDVMYLQIGDTVASVASSAVRAQLARSSGLAAVRATMHGLTPEGAALSWGTGAYSLPLTTTSGELIDGYGLRQRWLALLGSSTDEQRQGVTLPWLLRASTGENATGAMLRRWLAGERWPGAPSTLADLIAWLVQCEAGAPSS